MESDFITCEITGLVYIRPKIKSNDKKTIT